MIVDYELLATKLRNPEAEVEYEEELGIWVAEGLQFAYAINYDSPELWNRLY